MARYGDVKEVIQHLIGSPHRSLILIDEVTKEGPYFCFFDHTYDVKNIFLSIDQFNTTKAILSKGDPAKLYQDEDLPILDNLGSWKITIVIRKYDDTLIYKNGESCPTASLLGLE